MDWMKIKTRMQIKKTLMQMVTCTSAVLVISAMPVYGADGWQQDTAQQWFYMEHDKKVVNRWVTWADGTPRYLGGNGLIVTNNWVNAGGDRYRVKEDGSRYENEWFSVTSNPSLPSGKPSTAWYYAGADGKILVNGWHELEGRYYYFYPGGNSPRTSFFTAEDKRYYGDAEGVSPEPGWFSTENVDSKGNPYVNWYYVQPDGSLLTDGWHELDGITYYFDKNGNSPRKRWVNLEDNRYYVDDTGELMKGWFSITGTSSNGQEYTNWYYGDSNGVLWRGGWGAIDGKWYYFDPNGLNYRKRWYIDNVKGKRYYLDEDGVLQDKGWFKIENVNSVTKAVTESWYYAGEDGAVLKGGYKTIGDGAAENTAATERTYYFDANGLNYRKRWITDNNGDKRYMGDDGAMKKKEWFVISGLDSRNADYNNWYYAESDGKVIVDKWHKIDGKYYCFNASGVMRKGWLTETPEDDDKESSYYYCAEDGARAAGWQWLEIPETWMDNTDVADYVQEHGQYAYFYFSTTSGKKKRSGSGKQEKDVDGITYCFDSYGIMYPGWVKMSSTVPEIKGYRYFYRTETEKDKKYIPGEKVESAWLKLEGPPDASGSGQKEWYYFDNTGKPVCGGEDSYEIKKIGDGYYIFDMFGAAQYGLVEVKGDFYYCGAEDGDRKCAVGKAMVDDGVSATRSQYYFDIKGKGITGIKDGYAYYKGKMQKADKAARYEVFDIPGEGKCLVNAAGKVMKNTKVTDGNGQKWETGAGGSIKVYGSDEVAELEVPEATVSY